MERIWKAIGAGLLILGIFIGLGIYETSVTPKHRTFDIPAKKVIIDEKTTITGEYVEPEVFIARSPESTLVVNTFGNVITEITANGEVCSVWSYDLVSYLYGRKVRNAAIKYSVNNEHLVMELIPANKEYVFLGTAIIGLVTAFMTGAYVYMVTKPVGLCNA